MSVTFKRVLRKNPQDKQAPAKYYPQVITWGKPATLSTIAHKMTYSSSLTLGDIQSVLTNLVSTLRAELFAGHSVNIEGFGVFSLAATTEGSEKREDCQSDKIKSLRIVFRASSSVRPNLTSTRAEDYIDFVDLESRLEGSTTENPDDSDDTGGGGQGGTGEDGGVTEDPLA